MSASRGLNYISTVSIPNLGGLPRGHDFSEDESFVLGKLRKMLAQPNIDKALPLSTDCVVVYLVTEWIATPHGDTGSIPLNLEDALRPKIQRLVRKWNVKRMMR